MNPAIFIILIVVADLACLLVFQWARMRYFLRDRGASRGRGGLGAFGTVLAIGQLPLVALNAQHIEKPTLAAALALFAAAIGLFCYARRSHTGRRPAIASSRQAPEELVTWGAYRLARHPFYLAYILFWAGAVVASESAWVLAAAIVMAGLYTRTARQEERQILDTPLGERYRAYQRETGMFWPGPGPDTPGQTGPDPRR